MGSGSSLWILCTLRSSHTSRAEHGSLLALLQHDITLPYWRECEMEQVQTHVSEFFGLSQAAVLV